MQGISEVVQRELGKVGIRTTFELYDLVTYEKKMDDADYQLNYFHYGQTTFDPDELVGGAFVTGAARNVIDYSNPEVDRLFIAMSSELDPVKRKDLLRQIWTIVVVRDVAYATIPHFTADNYWWTRLQGVTLGFSPAFTSGVRRQDKLWLQN